MARRSSGARGGRQFRNRVGSRHELYEINYGGSTEEIRRHCLFGAEASGNAARFNGWTVPDLIDPGALSRHVLTPAP